MSRPKKTSSVDDLEAVLTEELNDAVKILDRVQAKYDQTAQELLTAGQKVSKLRAAIKALRGEFPDKLPVSAQTIASTVESEEAAPEGFKWTTNSFGEKSLVPVDLEVAPMTEPEKPDSLILPAIGDDSGFAPDGPQ